MAKFIGEIAMAPDEEEAIALDVGRNVLVESAASSSDELGAGDGGLEYDKGDADDKDGSCKGKRGKKNLRCGAVFCVGGREFVSPMRRGVDATTDLCDELFCRSLLVRGELRLLPLLPSVSSEARSGTNTTGTVVRRCGKVGEFLSRAICISFSSRTS